MIGGIAQFSTATLTTCLLKIVQSNLQARVLLSCQTRHMPMHWMEQGKLSRGMLSRVTHGDFLLIKILTPVKDLTCLRIVTKPKGTNLPSLSICEGQTKRLVTCCLTALYAMQERF